MNSSIKENDILYFKQYIDLLLQPDESLEEFDTLYNEVEEALRNLMNTAS